MDNRNPNKRPRDDGSDELVSCPPPQSKLIRTDSVTESISSDANSGDVRDRADSEDLDIDSAEAKLIQEDLLNILEDADVRDAAIQDLDSVIKSFEEEIIKVPAVPAFETTSVSGESSSSQPELGYLLEASDDELGLPPTNNASEESRMEAADFTAASTSETVAALDGMLGMFDNDVIIPSYYDAFDFGVVGGGYSLESNGGGGEYVALGGLFDYDGGVSEVPWRTGSLFAL